MVRNEYCGSTKLVRRNDQRRLGTLYNSPHEYGAHWTGFGECYGMRLTGISVSNGMEASLGAAWGEDPAISATRQ
jgi:hypothetical protein